MEDDSERRPIGEIFVEHGVVSQSQLDAAVLAQRDSGQRLGEVLVAQGAITRLELASALAEQWSTLQKIRPPEPKAAEPWQESAVRAAGSDPTLLRRRSRSLRPTSNTSGTPSRRWRSACEQ